MPLDPKLTKFTTTSPVIATFQAQDLEEGTGKQIYFGISSNDGTVDYHLISNAVYSSQKHTRGSGTATFSMDFDLGPFNLPRTAKGTAYFSAGLHESTGGNSSLAVQVKKWDGSSETNISSKITSATLTGNGGAAATMVFLEIPLTQTDFEVGDVLRLTVDLIHTSASTGTVGHDPKNRTVTFNSVAMDSSVMEFQMSYRIE